MNTFFIYLKDIWKLGICPNKVPYVFGLESSQLPPHLSWTVCLPACLQCCRVLVVRWDKCACACLELLQFREDYGRRRLSYSNKCHPASSTHPPHDSWSLMRFQWEWGVIVVTCTSFPLAVPSEVNPTLPIPLWNTEVQSMFSFMNTSIPNYRWTTYQDKIVLWYSKRPHIV